MKKKKVYEKKNEKKKNLVQNLFGLLLNKIVS